MYQLSPRPGKVAAKQPIVGFPGPAIARPAGWPTAPPLQPMGCSQGYSLACTALHPCAGDRQRQHKFAAATYLSVPAPMMRRLLCPQGAEQGGPQCRSGHPGARQAVGSHPPAGAGQRAAPSAAAAHHGGPCAAPAERQPGRAGRSAVAPCGAKSRASARVPSHS